MTTISHTAIQLALRVRLLTVGGLPALAAEQKKYTPVVGTPYVEESLVPATQQLQGMVTGGFAEHTGLYVLTYYGKPNEGLTVSTAADAILAKFAPGLALTATDGSVVHVRGDIAPNRGQVRQINGWAVCTITVPYRVLS